MDALHKAIEILKSENKLVLGEDYLPEVASGAPQGSIRISEKPNASDAPFVLMSDKEFLRYIDYDISADEYNRRRLNSRYFSERVESLLSNPIGR